MVFEQPVFEEGDKEGRKRRKEVERACFPLRHFKSITCTFVFRKSLIFVAPSLFII